MWEKRTPPQEIAFEDIQSENVEFNDSKLNGNHKDGKIDLSNPVIRDQQLWSIKDCLNNFCDSLTKLYERLVQCKPGTCLHWDKDDEWAIVIDELNQQLHVDSTT